MQLPSTVVSGIRGETLYVSEPVCTNFKTTLRKSRFTKKAALPQLLLTDDFTLSPSDGNTCGHADFRLQVLSAACSCLVPDG